MTPPDRATTPSTIAIGVGAARFGIAAERVREVLVLGDLTPVPGAPEAVAGLTQVRGQVVAVLDAAVLSGAGQARRQAGDPLLLVDTAAGRVAFAVDAILDGPGQNDRASDATHRIDAIPLIHIVDFEAILASLGARSAGTERALFPERAGGPAVAATDARERREPHHSSPVSLSAADLRQLRTFFLDEAETILDAIDQALLAMVGDPDHAGPARATLLRELHTLKGSAGSVALDELAALTHRIEDRVLALGNKPIAPHEIASLVSAVEHLRAQAARAARPLEVTAEMAALGPGANALPAAGEAPRIRVEVARVDALMESVGGLVLDRSRIVRRLQELEHAARELLRVRAALDEGRRDPLRVDAAAQLLDGIFDRIEATTAHLLADTDGLRRTAKDMQEGLSGMRTMEVGRLFERLAAPLRELALRSGREIEVRTAGVATAVDKLVVERIGDPLLHLLRNAVAHGIEPVEVRIALGKPRAGRVELSARQRGDRILLEVADDGAGIDVAGVRRALVRSGRLARDEAAALTDDEAITTIFEPGVSTREGADDLAGRGLGLDAVKEAIARLGGGITCTSTPGRGTRFTVRLPLTTAIARALLFKVGGQVYAVPAAEVVESGHLDVPAALSLGDLLGDGAISESVDAPPVIVLSHEGARFTVACDKLIGEREIVIMGLGPLLSSLPLFAGATISGAGKVQLLLDVAELARRVNPAPGTESIRPARVLVVDDSRTAREACARTIAAAGHHVTHAAGGDEAFTILKRESFDLVVTDLEMPAGDGYGLLARMQAHRALSSVPVIAVSSSGAEGRRRALSAGANAFIDKPAPARALGDAVAKALSRR